MFRWLAPWLLGLGLNLPAPAKDPDGASSVLLATNQVLVTNVVVVTVTNDVVATNTIVVTNDPPDHPAAPPLQDLIAPNSALPPLDWVPPPDTFDWIQLKSGEWLKGRFKGMQGRELDFESEELDTLTFDWVDIRQVRTFRSLSALFTDDTLLSGPVSVTPAEIIVGGETPGRMPRPALQSLTPAGSWEREFWSGKASLGLTLRGGNTEQLDYTASASLQRRSPFTRLTLDYTGNFSESGGEETANSHRATTQFNVWLSQRLYLFVPQVEYFRDPFQNLAHRLTGSVGLGYDIITRRTVEWTVMAGPAYQYAWFESAQPGESTRTGTPALVFGTGLDWDITRRVEFSLDYRGQYTSREAGETTQHTQATLSIDITRRLDLDISFTWDRIANPKVGSDGVQPKPDDYRLIFGLGLDF